MGARCAHSHGKAILPTQPLTFFSAIAQVFVREAVIKLMRPSKQRKSKVERVTAPAGVRVFFIAQPQCTVRVAQHPGANRRPDTG